MAARDKVEYKPGWVVGHRYEVIRRFRPEPFGQVVLARDQILDVEVGLKILPADDPQFDRVLEYFRAEAAFGFKLRQPQILGIFHLDETPECVFLVQEAFEGTTLMDLLGRNEGLSVPDALYFIEVLSKGLAYAHKQGIIHQNFNPQNVLVSATEGVKIANFAFPPEDSESGQPREYQAYIPPEVIQGEVPTPASNLFSLGVLGYRMLAGRQPFPVIQDEVFPYRIVEGAVELEAIPPALRPVLALCLDKNPEKRFQSVAEFLIWLGRSRELLGAETEPLGPSAAVAQAISPEVRDESPGSEAEPKEAEPEKQVGPEWLETEEPTRQPVGERLRHWLDQGRRRFQEGWQSRPFRDKLVIYGIGLGGGVIILLLALYVIISGLPGGVEISGGPGGQSGIQRSAKGVRGKKFRQARRPAVVSSKSKTTGPYGLLVATYAAPRYAYKLVGKLDKQGYQAHIRKSSGRNRTYYQVWLTSLPTEARAEAAARSIKAAYGLNSKVVKFKSSR